MWSGKRIGNTCTGHWLPKFPLWHEKILAIGDVIELKSTTPLWTSSFHGNGGKRTLWGLTKSVKSSVRNASDLPLPVWLNCTCCKVCSCYSHANMLTYQYWPALHTYSAWSPWKLDTLKRIYRVNPCIWFVQRPLQYIVGWFWILTGSGLNWGRIFIVPG